VHCDHVYQQILIWRSAADNLSSADNYQQTDREAAVCLCPELEIQDKDYYQHLSAANTAGF
jgi:hypothetical protein